MKKIKSESMLAANAVLAIIAITFCIELLIMASLSLLGYVMVPGAVVFADAALLATLSATPIYLLVLRPIRREYEKRLQAEGLAENMSRLAITDPLTRIMNRRGITVGLLDAMAQSERYGTPLSVGMADIDHFKEVNDTHGHDAGDRVLVGIAGVLAEALRMPDKVGRYGGEEFLVIFPHTALPPSRRIAERIRRTVEATSFDIGGNNLQLTLSIGLAQFQKGEDLERLISRVDKALYNAKEQGRNRVVLSKEDIE